MAFDPESYLASKQSPAIAGGSPTTPQQVASQAQPSTGTGQPPEINPQMQVKTQPPESQPGSQPQQSGPQDQSQQAPNASQQQQPQATPFNPEAYLASKQIEPAPTKPVSFTDNLKNLVKGVVDQLPIAGATVGGVIAGAAATPETLGAATVPAAVLGSALGGAAGRAVENEIKSIFWPEEAPKTGLDVTLSTVNGATMGAIQEVGGQIVSKVIDSAIQAAPAALNSIKSYLAQKAIPLNEKYIERLGGEAGLDKLSGLLQDEAVTTVPRTLRGVGEKLTSVVNTVGDALKSAYKAVDEAATNVFTGKQMEDEMVKNYTSYIESSGKAVSDKDILKVRRIFREYIKPDDVVNHEDIWAATRSMQGKLYDKTDIANKTLAQSASISLRKANADMATMVAPKEFTDTIQELSSNYNKLATAKSAVDAKLRKEPGILSRAFQSLPYLAGANYFGAKGLLAAGAINAAQTTTAKTTVAYLASQGAEIMKMVPQLGNYGKALAGIAAAKGYAAVAERHANLMHDNDKYRATFNAGIGQQQNDQSQPQQPAQAQPQQQ